MKPETLAQAQDVARGVLAHVTTEQMDLPTPCAKWNVAQLVDHLIGAQLWARSTIEGSEMTETGEGSAQGDFVGAFDRAARGALEAVSAEGALDRTVDPGFGAMPASALLSMAVTDTFTHAWDLARATGQGTDLEPELAADLLEQSRRTFPDSYRSEEGSVFGYEQEAPDDAPAADRLAAFLGREV